MTIKVHDKTTEKVTGILNEFPDFILKCKLGKVLEDRGLTLQEVSDLTGLRVATISELSNMKRTSINVPHLLVIAQVLRIDDISELFEFEMSEETKEVFEKDQQTIERSNLLPDQEETLHWLRYERKLIQKFYKIAKWKPTKTKKKPTSD